MAADAKLGSKDISQVRIPAELLGRWDSFWRSVKLRILETSARQARARQTDAKPGCVVAADLVQSARALLPAAAKELEHALSSHETGHVRNAS